MSKNSTIAYDSESLEIARMFTRAIDVVFSSDRIHSKDLGEVGVGKRQQEATAQAILDYILRQDDEARNFSQALKYRGGDWSIDKEVSFTETNRVDHVLYCDDTPTIYIEDKIWAQFGLDQLRRYRDELVSHDTDGLLLVVVPERRREEAIREMEYSQVSDSTRIVTWHELPELVADHSDKPHLWHALSTYAEETGSSNLIELAASGSFPQSREVAEHISYFLASADEVSELFHKVSGIARGTTGTRRRFKFSHNGSNGRPWLQSGATGNENWGLEIDPGFPQRSGIWLSHQRSDNYFDLKIGYFRRSLSQSAQNRVREIAQLCFDQDTELYLQEGTFRRLGTFLTQQEQDSLNVLMHVFDVRTAKNYLPTNTKFAGTNDKTYRHGMTFTLGERAVDAFLGPRPGTDWACPSIYIRSDNDESEVLPLPGQTGKDYVLAVWQEISDLLLP